MIASMQAHMPAQLRRTQIYLTLPQQSALAHMALSMGITRSALVRSAIDAWLAEHQGANKIARRLSAAGGWQADRPGPDLRELRAEKREL